MGLYYHYYECSRVTGLPFVLYNIPGRTGVNSIPATYAKLLEIPNVKAVKHAVNDLGIPVGRCRLPLCEMEKTAAGQIGIAGL